MPLPQPGTPLRASGRQILAASAAVVAAAALVLGGAVRHSFLTSYDDDDYVVSNPVLRAPPVEAIRGAFTTTPLEAWAPLHILSHVVDQRLFGTWAGGYVLVNVALHALVAVLLGLLALRLGSPPLAAAVAALLFAVHPVQVEAVVWVSQRKTVLSAAFMLAALHAWVSYARADPGRRWRGYSLALLATAAALMSKAVAIVTPGALAMVDAPLGRTRPRLRWIAEKVPFLVAAAAVALATVLTKTEVASTASVYGNVRSIDGGIAYYAGGRLGTFYTMATILPRYLGLILWPRELSIIYLPPLRPTVDLEVAASLLLAAALAAAAVPLARRSPRLFCWYAMFFLGLLPASQILFPQVTLMNDRYLYVPMLGAAPLAAEGMAEAARLAGGRWRVAVVGVAAATLVALGVAAHARVPFWRDELTLWRDAVAHAPGSPYAWFNLARALERRGRDDEALAGYERAISIDPLQSDAATNAGALKLRRGDLAGAEPFLETAVRLGADTVESRFDLALLRFLQGRLAEAEVEARRAVEVSGGDCRASGLLGHVLAIAGRPADASRAYDAALARGCTDPEIGLYHAYVRSELGDESAALAGLSQAIPAGARLGREFVARQTLVPLRAQPRFDALLRKYAAGAREAHPW